jgi:hypothetical protein
VSKAIRPPPPAPRYPAIARADATPPPTITSSNFFIGLSSFSCDAALVSLRRDFLT